MPEASKILVAGAGASGLAFALACAHRGITVRILDRRPERTSLQKATGVAQGVWRQLAPYGITAMVINDAIPMRNFVFYDDGHLVANVPVPLVNGEPPAHLYPQGSLEAAMEKALLAVGVAVEYGATVSASQQTDETIYITITRQSAPPEIVEADWLIGADGAQSNIRTSTGLLFRGRDYPESWSVAEITTKQWPDDVQAQLHLRHDGVGLFLSQPTPGLVQGILNGVGVAAIMHERFTDAALLYERRFKVSLRRVRTPRFGRIWLIGDAAHVQSPVGGQGLNLAIWDGVTLGNALSEADVSVERLLARRAKRVLFFTDFDYRMLSTRSRLLRNIRNLYWFIASRYQFLAGWFFKLISGVW